jgi:hypothetical protein
MRLRRPDVEDRVAGAQEVRPTANRVSRRAEEVRESAVPFRDGVERLVDLCEREGVVFEDRQVEGAGAGHVGHVLGLAGGEPQASQSLRCEHIIANRSRPRRSVMPPMSTNTPPREGVDGFEHGFGPGAYQDYYTQFAAALRGEADFPVAAEQAVHTLEVLDAARISAAENRVVELPQD